jgi:hypothetical protein
MIIGKCIDGTVKGDPLLNTLGIIELLFPFYKIADEIAR